jgi:hypothetical protein
MLEIEKNSFSGDRADGCLASNIYDVANQPPNITVFPIKRMSIKHGMKAAPEFLFAL